MLKRVLWQMLSSEQKNTLLQRPSSSDSPTFTKTVHDIIDKVRSQGDDALFSLTKQFDRIVTNSLRVTQKECAAAMNHIEPQVIQAFERVILHLTAFHQKQMMPNYSVETSPGIVCEQLAVPIQRVGLYVPAGSAPLVSTVLMLGVPSRLAGCPLRVLCVPPNQKGEIDPYILVAADLCGIENIFKVGGAQAIAAMAYGTESIPKVDKIFGPGNRFVTKAKMLVSLDTNGAQLDLPAGPSEVMVIADDTANPAFVASDLLAQAEHGEDSQVFLICKSDTFAHAVNVQLERQLQQLSRAAIAAQSLKNSVCAIVNDAMDAIQIANDYAPEHLILQLMNARDYLPVIHTAGSIFLGAYSPESVGDYASGTNHVLPTGGFAKAASGLSLRDFMRTMSVQTLTQYGLADISETIRILTTIEGLDAHQNAIDIRVRGVR